MQRDPESWLRVDASRPVPEIHAEIRQAIGWWYHCMSGTDVSITERLWLLFGRDS